MVCNSRKDVEAIYNASGVLQARYIYDAWGNTKVVDASNNEITNTSHIGNINPIRYRGYYYDSETNLYYLLSRYYDADTCRFISADDVGVVSLDITSLYDKNLYAYCDNNPVGRKDEVGHFWLQLYMGAFNASLTIFSAMITNQEIVPLDVTISFVTGMMGASGLGMAVGGAVIDGIYALCKERNNGNSLGNSLAKGAIAFGGSLLTVNNALDFSKIKIDKVIATVVDITFSIPRAFCSASLSTLVPDAPQSKKESQKKNDNYYIMKRRMLHEVIFGFE